MPRPKPNIPEPNPSGLCMCGCGQPTAIASQSHRGKGWLIGKPVQFIPGHNNRLRIARMEYRINPDTGCWDWLGDLKDGYAYTSELRQRRAARVFYEERHGAIPDGLVVDHLCRNRACVNPDHLEAVSIAENCRRRPTTKLTPDDVRTIRSLAGIVSQKELASRYGVGAPYISMIVNRKAWRDVA